MADTQFVTVLCRITRSAFSGERIIRIRQAAGDEYVGIISVRHCRRSNGERLERDEPPTGQEADGMVDGLLLANGGARAHVALPNGESVVVSVDQVLREQIKVTGYVPL